MKNAVIGLVIGIVVGVAGGWLLTSLVVVAPVQHELDNQKSLNERKNISLLDMQAERKVLVTKIVTNREMAEEQLASKDAEISKLKATNEDFATTVAGLKKQLAGMEKTASKEEVAQKPDDAKEDPEDLGMAIRKMMESITTIGGPLNKLAVKELSLDENQVAGINELLKEEGKRMRKCLVEWMVLQSSTDKTAKEIEQMSDLELAYAIGQHVTKELELLQKLPPEKLKTIHVKNHFIKFLPKDGKLVSIVKMLYEERQKTYGGLAAYLNEKQEKVIKEKYITSGTFIFPGAGSFGIGHLEAEDFEE